MERLFGAGEEKFKQLIKNSFDMIVLLDSNGTQKYVSESCNKILGYQPEELMNISVIESMIHPEDQKEVFEGFNDILNKRTNGGVQYRHRHKDGSWVYLEAVGTNQIDNPHIKSIVLNVRDVTKRIKVEKELKESENQLRELNTTKDRFFSIIAHDLKSPFNSIVGLSDLIEKLVEQKNYEGLSSYVKIIQESSQKAMNLLTNLLVWAQAQTGRIEFNPEYFELVELINEVVDLFKDLAYQKSISIKCELADNILVYADKEMISTVLRNLVSNGIKFTNSGGKVLIKVTNKDSNLFFCIEDTGIGINEENLSKLFQIENNYSTPGTKQETGTGLGLLLCKEFIDMHGGKIWVNSEKDKGSTFCFSIPNESCS